MTEAEIEQRRRGLIRRMALASTALASPALARDECVLPVEAPNPLVPGDRLPRGLPRNLLPGRSARQGAGSIARHVGARRTSDEVVDAFVDRCAAALDQRTHPIEEPILSPRIRSKHAALRIVDHLARYAA